MTSAREGRLLIVGFGPFPRVPRNPSGVLARRITGLPRCRRVLSAAPRALVLRTTYDAIASHPQPALAGRWDAVLLIGVAMRAKRVRVESRARNRVSRLFPDASGSVSARLVLDPDGPTERRAAMAVCALVRLRRHGLDALSSRDAGRYLCNAAYYRALAGTCPTLFLHIPPLPRSDRRSAGRVVRRQRPIEAWANAFADVALYLTRPRIRRICAAAQE